MKTAAVQVLLSRSMRMAARIVPLRKHASRKTAADCAQTAGADTRGSGLARKAVDGVSVQFSHVSRKIKDLGIMSMVAYSNMVCKLKADTGLGLSSRHALPDCNASCKSSALLTMVVG